MGGWGRQGGDERGNEGGQGGGRVPGGSARLTWGARGRPGEQQQPEAGEQQPRAAVAGGRPAAAPLGHQCNPGAGLPLHGHASAPRHPGTPAPPAWTRSGPGRRRPLRRRLGSSHQREASEAGEAGAGPAGSADWGRCTPAAPLRPLPSLTAAAGQRTARRGEASTTSRPAWRLPAGGPAEDEAGPGPRPPPRPASQEGAREGAAPYPHPRGAGGTAANRVILELAPPEPPTRGGQQVCVRGSRPRSLADPGLRSGQSPKKSALYPRAHVPAKAGEEAAHRAQPVLCLSRALPPCEGGPLERPGPTALSLVSLQNGAAEAESRWPETDKHTDPGLKKGRTPNV